MNNRPPYVIHSYSRETGKPTAIEARFFNKEEAEKKAKWKNEHDVLSNIRYFQVDPSDPNE